MKKGHDILLSLPGLKIIHHKVPGKEMGSHHHDEHEFFLPLAGEIVIGYEGKKFNAGPGKMLYVPPKIEHSFSSSTLGTGERVICLIDDSLWRKHGEKNFPITVFPSSTLAKELLFYLLLKRQIKGQKYFISALLESFVDSIESSGIANAGIELTHLMGKINDERILKSMKIMNEKLETDSLSIVAKNSGMSLRNFNRIFLKTTGLTPKEYLQMKRMDKARSLLMKSNHTITDIALKVGFNSISKFIEAFKKIEGKLPSDYRNENYLMKDK